MNAVNEMTQHPNQHPDGGTTAGMMDTSRMSARVAQAIEEADAFAATDVFTAIFKAEALAAAAEEDRQIVRPGHPTRGQPMILTVKDNIDVTGHVTRAGSPARAKYPPAQHDSDVVARLRAGRHIILGQTNMTELAFTGLGINPAFGTPLNPSYPNERRIPGGSSAGAAVSVALGIADAAVGTDTGGSVRIPAAMCGLVGFKPTGASVSKRGVVPLSPTLDAVGVIAPAVAACAKVFEAVRDRPCASAPRPAPVLRGMRLGAVQDYVLADLDQWVACDYAKAIRSFVDAGAIVEPCRFPELLELPEIHRHGTLAGAEAHAIFHVLVDKQRAEMDPMVAASIDAGGQVSAAAYLELLSHRARLAQLLRLRAAPFDALMMPTLPIIAPSFEELADPAIYQRVNLLVLRNPTIVNFMDGCAISLPCSEAGAPPTGLTVFCAGGDDDRLLEIAAVLEPRLADASAGYDTVDTV